MEHRPAIMKDKAVVKVSTCLIHPKYAAQREPSSKAEGCTCREIWQARAK